MAISLVTADEATADVVKTTRAGSKRVPAIPVDTLTQYAEHIANGNVLTDVCKHADATYKLKGKADARTTAYYTAWGIRNQMVAAKLTTVDKLTISTGEVLDGNGKSVGYRWILGAK